MDVLHCLLDMRFVCMNRENVIGNLHTYCYPYHTYLSTWRALIGANGVCVCVCVLSQAVMLSAFTTSTLKRGVMVASMDCALV